MFVPKHSVSWYTYKGAFAFITYLQVNIYIMTYLHEHLHHGIPTWTFTSWHTYMNICIMAYLQGGIYIIAYHQKDIRIIACTNGPFAFIAYLQAGICIHDIPTWAFTSWHTYMNICIMTYSQVDIRIMACTKGTFASWHPYKKHLHHDMPIRRHLHHKTFCISISVRRHLHHR